MKQVLVIVIPSVIVALLGWLFLDGIFFAWSPVKPGYLAKDFGRFQVISPPGKNPVISPDKITRALAETENNLQLKFKRKIKIIFPKNSKQQYRYSGGKAQGLTFATGDVIFLSPGITEQKRDPYKILKHELCHALMFQHSGVLGALAMKAWYVEGIAVWFGNPDEYTRQQFRHLAITRGYFFDILSGPKVSGHGRFNQAEYRYFIEYLVKKYGNEKLLYFIKSIVRSPRNFVQVFDRVYGEPLTVAAENFQSDFFREPGLMRR